MDAERRERFDTELTAPLPGHEKTRPVVNAAAEMEGQAFMAAMQQHQALTGG